MQEVEVKIGLVSGELDSLRQMLVASGAVAGAIDDEENQLFDFANGSIRSGNQILRIRSFAGKTEAQFTFKGPEDPASRYKSREELQVQVSDGASLRAILEAIGLEPRAYYNKHREYWKLNGAEVVLDRLNSGDYLEIEADEQTIDETLAQLGLAGRPHITQGYASLAGRAIT